MNKKRYLCDLRCELAVKVLSLLGPNIGGRLRGIKLPMLLLREGIEPLNLGVLLLTRCLHRAQLTHKRQKQVHEQSPEIAMNVRRKKQHCNIDYKVIDMYLGELSSEIITFRF